MSVMSARKWLAIACAVLAHLPAHSYEEGTHRDISQVAAQSSCLADTLTLDRFGLGGGLSDAGALFRNSRSQLRTIEQLIMDGAEFEDAPAYKVVNHFFDPKYDSAYWITFFTSPTWALEDKGAIPGRTFSLRDGREYLYQALTNPSPDERAANWGLAFETIGHVIHHLQDMSQPQHVRSDSHLNFAAVIDNALTRFLSQRTFSRYEKYTLRIRPGARQWMPTTGYAAFPRGRDYWTNPSHTGIADYTNRNFVSQGTNFLLKDGAAVSDSRYFLPVPSATPIQVRTIWELFAEKQLFPSPETQARCPNVGFGCEVLFFGTSGLPDNPRASSLSMFDQDLRITGKTVAYRNPDTGFFYQVDRLFALNEFNFDAALKLLLPRATASSTGMINYFFRGSLELDLPGGVTRGASAVTVNVKNNTLWVDAVGGPAAESVATGTDGTLVAIVKFKLSGFTDVASYVSNPVTNIPNINSAAQPIAFTLRDPIPVTATDIHVQVVYRGRVGEELDSVAVGMATYHPTATGFIFASEFEEPTKVYSAATRQLVAQIPFVPDGDSYLMSITPDGGRVFRSEFGTQFGQVTVIDVNGDAQAQPPIPPFSVVASILTGSNWPQPVNSMVSPDGNFLYVVLDTGGTNDEGALVLVDLRKQVLSNGQPQPNPRLYQVLQAIDVVGNPWNIAMSPDGTRIILNSQRKDGFNGDRPFGLAYAAGYVYHLITVSFDANGDPTMSAPDTRALPRGPYYIAGFTVTADGQRFHAHANGVPDGYNQGAIFAKDPNGTLLPWSHLDPRYIVMQPGRSPVSTFKTPLRDFAISIQTGNVDGIVVDNTPIPDLDKNLFGYAESADGEFRYFLDGEFITVQQGNQTVGTIEVGSAQGMAVTNQRRLYPPLPAAPFGEQVPEPYCGLNEFGDLSVETTDRTRPLYAVEMPRRYKVRIARYNSSPPYMVTPISGPFPRVGFELWNERKTRFIRGTLFGFGAGAPNYPQPGTFTFALDFSHPSGMSISCTPGANVWFNWAGAITSAYEQVGTGNVYTEPVVTEMLFETWRGGDDRMTTRLRLFPVGMVEGQWYEMVFPNDTGDPSVKEFFVQPDSGLPPTYQ
jgi:hypothetical protein